MIGLLLITHGNLADSLVHCAAHVLGRTPEQLLTLSAGHDEPREAVEAALRQGIAQLDQGDGVLLLTDLFGATPCNLAQAVVSAASAGKVAGVAGVSLPMLLRAINYRHLPLADLQAKVAAAGADCTVTLSQ
jgi:PTS system ascorbate-specific IIA component